MLYCKVAPKEPMTKVDGTLLFLQNVLRRFMEFLRDFPVYLKSTTAFCSVIQMPQPRGIQTASQARVTLVE